MKYNLVDINSITPYHKNSKKHPAKQVKQIANSIKAFGFNQPIVVNKENIIVVGHGRYEGAKLLGLKEVPVYQIDLNKEQTSAYALADNKLNESEWDMGLVIEALKELSPEMLDLTGFDKDLLIEPDEKDDEIPENPPAIAKLGDIYQLGNHRVMCGDSTKIEVVEKLMDGKKADMYLSDPPYNVALGMDETSEQAKKRNRRTDGLVVMNDKKTDEEFRKFLGDAFSAVDINLKQGAVFYIWHADSEGYNFRGACQDNNWKVRQCLIWKKSSIVMGRQDYHWQYEPCLYGWKEGAGHLWNTDRKQSTILTFEKPSNSKLHPTMKPVELLTYQIQNNTKGDDIVIDTFLGSGSTLIACEKTNRICYGMELDPKYMDVIIKRYEDYTGDKVKKC